jgi:hypothetical protein
MSATSTRSPASPSRCASAADFDHPSSVIDYRLYLPRLMEDFQERGGETVIYHGVEYSEPKGVGVHLSLGQGELLELPITSREGFVTALLFENIPGGDLEVLADIRYEDDPDRFHRVVLDKLQEHYPMCFERIDRVSFGLQGPTDLLQGALTPVVCEDPQPPAGRRRAARRDGSEQTAV